MFTPFIGSELTAPMSKRKHQPFRQLFFSNKLLTGRIESKPLLLSQCDCEKPCQSVLILGDNDFAFWLFENFLHLRRLPSLS